ncbi:hypothetical protein OPQ81_005036 [Rhizoctonia solani]|nr:hypothetical protein OPQ81_005036 [Rhizoctonia solani]
MLLSAAELGSSVALPAAEKDTLHSADKTSRSIEHDFSSIAGRSAVVSDIPLDDFGAFSTLTLQEVVDDPTLLDTVNSINSTTPNDATGNVKTVALAVEDSPRPQPVPPHRHALSGVTIPLRTARRSAYSPSTSRYEDLVQTHQKLTTQVHGNGIFLLWHRYFVHLFEQALRTECGFDRALPWWDETLDSGAFHLSTLFTAQYFGNLSGPTNGAGTCVTDGDFRALDVSYRARDEQRPTLPLAGSQRD